MKKLINIFLIFNLIIWSLAAETIQIETSKGKTDLVIPETQEELREAFIEMTQLYVEERYDHEELLENYKKVEESFNNLKVSLEEQQINIDLYVKDNKLLREQYNETLKDYDALVKTLEKKNRRKPVQGILGVELGFKDQFTEMIPAVELGISIFEKVLIKTRISYPWELGLGVGFTF